MFKSLTAFKGFKRFSKQSLRLTSIVLGTALILGGSAYYLQASDHDDGEVDTKGRNLNLTDLYVFRESDQNPQVDEDDLVLIMNTNPRSLARQQYYFSTNARYEFHISRMADKNAPATGKADVTLRFEFSAPNDKQEQLVTMTAIRDGHMQTATAVTTPLIDTTDNVRQVSLGDDELSLFAGLREDPFFFDVEQFFRVRAG
ncbi:MAG: DUF4331 domain-containing protein, partial [Leptolyngbya sp. SIO1D8]|nr:DUF4331 domain-containing protein [Leptolyngbya sp. SIO1D8]